MQGRKKGRESLVWHYRDRVEWLPVIFLAILEYLASSRPVRGPFLKEQGSQHLRNDS